MLVGGGRVEMVYPSKFAEFHKEIIVVRPHFSAPPAFVHFWALINKFFRVSSGVHLIPPSFFSQNRFYTFQLTSQTAKGPMTGLAPEAAANHP